MSPGPEMREALRLARESIHEGGGPFGAVVCREGRIVGRGRNRVVETHDPTAHAEVSAIRDAARGLGTHDLSGCTIFTTCEPCPMCLGSIYWARITRVVYGASRTDAAAVGFDDATIYEELARDPHARRIAFAKEATQEARAVLEAWHAEPGRRPY